MRTATQAHRVAEVPKADRQGDAKHLAILVIADNYSTHKRAKVKRWLERHLRFHVHFTPTSASWLNMVEHFSRDITTQRIRRGAFRSVRRLVGAIQANIKEHNLDPQPFIWTAKASDILAKVTRAKAALADDSPSFWRTTLGGGSMRKTIALVSSLVAFSVGAYLLTRANSEDSRIRQRIDALQIFGTWTQRRINSEWKRIGRDGTVRSETLWSLLGPEYRAPMSMVITDDMASEFRRHLAEAREALRRIERDSPRNQQVLRAAMKSVKCYEYWVAKRR